VSPFTQQFRSGALAIAPLAAAVAPFGLIFGAQSVRHGLTAPETALMSATVFAGGAQFLAVDLWRQPAPWLSLAFAVLLVNLRHTLMGASLVRKMQNFRPWQRWVAAFVMADEIWAVSERCALSRPLTPAYYAGAGLTMYVVWQVATALGTKIGAYVPNPEAFGLDFAFPTVFICMVMGFAKSWRAAPIIAASAAAALIARHLFGGTWYVIVGGLAGMAAAMALPSSSGASPR
jgi:4-azaleucine resistance transporter AzlC